MSVQCWALLSDKAKERLQAVSPWVPKVSTPPASSINSVLGYKGRKLRKRLAAKEVRREKEREK